MKRLIFTLLALFVASPGFGQTYATALAKMDHVYVGESYAGGASTVLADEAGAINATLAGGDNVEDLETTGPTAWLSTALQLDGANDYLTTASSIGVDATTDFTLFCWVKRDTTGTRMCIASANSINDVMRFNANTTELETYLNGGTLTATAHGVDTTGWHSYAFVRDDAAAEVDIYVDGAFVATASNLGNEFNVDYICARSDGNQKLDGAFAGWMIANEQLSSTEIALLHAGPSAGSPLLLIILMSAVLPLSYITHRYFRGR